MFSLTTHKTAAWFCSGLFVVLGMLSFTVVPDPVHATIDRPVGVSGFQGAFKWTTYGYDIRDKTPRRKRLARFYHRLAKHTYKKLNQEGFGDTVLVDFSMGKPPGSATGFMNNLRSHLSRSDSYLAQYMERHADQFTAHRIIEETQYKEFISQTPGLHLSLLWWVDHYYLIVKTDTKTQPFELPGKRSFGSMPCLITPSPEGRYIVYRSGGYGLHVIDRNTGEIIALTPSLEKRTVVTKEQTREEKWDVKYSTPVKLKWIGEDWLGIVYDHGAHDKEEFLLVDIRNQSIQAQKTGWYRRFQKWSTTKSDTQWIISFRDFPNDPNRQPVEPIKISR